MNTTITKALFIFMMVLFGTGLSAQAVIPVTSDLDSGLGTLRQSIIDAAPGDSIVIPADYTIVLDSAIAFDKSLTINGQGALVKVTDPGVSNWRIFMVGTITSTPKVVSMHNLRLEGGNVSLFTGGDGYGGIMIVRRNHTFTMKNCTLSKGKGTYAGGLFIHEVIGTSVILEDCTISDNECTTGNGGALIIRGFYKVNNCTFSNNVNSGLNGGAIAIYDNAAGSMISNSRFIGNSSHAPAGGAIVNYSTTNSVDLENCTFESNTNTPVLTYTTGAGGFAIANAAAKSILTNCTFYNNSGSTAGAIFNNQGTITLVNCTFAGNSTPSAKGGAFGNVNNANAKTTFINCIAAYNYNSAGLMDVVVTSPGVLTGKNNIIGAITGGTLTNPITFNYSPASDLFADYTTTGNLMPVLADNGGFTKTVALSTTSIAYSAGVQTYQTPINDQRGIARVKKTPAIGSYERYVIPIPVTVATLTVSSALDSGAGTLRQLIIDANDGDSIVIPADYTIVLESQIAFDKSLAINGQGSLVKVVEPGVSAWRVFSLGTTESPARTVSMYNLRLEGGKVSDMAGIIYVRMNHNFTMKNCTLSKGVGPYAGAIFGHNAFGTSITLEDCNFSNNEATTAHGGAMYIRGKIRINNCTFTNNKAQNGGAVVTTDASLGSLISNCRFIGNSTVGNVGGALVNYSGTNPVDVENCTFESNTKTIAGTNTVGAGGFSLGSVTGKSTLTNCTFYNNVGATSGAVHNANGTLNMVNCTLAGNSTPSAIGGGAFYDANNANCKTNIINCILAYNYNSAGLSDVSTTALGVLSGQNNIIGIISGAGTPAFTNPVTFNYSPASDLFADYTTTGNLMPVLADNGGFTKTVALSTTSIAYSAGIATYGTPNIIPVKDQRGEVRAAISGIGSYETNFLTVDVKTPQKADLYVYMNSTNVLNISKVSDVKRLDIIDLSGKTVLSVAAPTASISLNALSKGMYLVHITTMSGNLVQKICI